MKTPKLGLVWCPRRSIEATYLPIMRCPVYKRRDSNPGSRMELENRVGDDKGKGTSGDPTRLKVPMHRSGAHCLVVAVKRGKARRAKGAGHPRRDGVNGQPEELLVLAEAGRLPRGGTSRMNREIHVRICGGLGVQIPGSTRRESVHRQAVRSACLTPRYRAHLGAIRAAIFNVATLPTFAVHLSPAKFLNPLMRVSSHTFSAKDCVCG